MTAVSVTTSNTVIVAPNQSLRFIHIRNMHGASTLYVCYDGGAATTANGMAVLANETLHLDMQEACVKGVTGIAGVTIDVRVQVG